MTAPERPFRAKSPNVGGYLKTSVFLITRLEKLSVKKIRTKLKLVRDGETLIFWFKLEHIFSLFEPVVCIYLFTLSQQESYLLLEMK